jgi:hypothetical protein
MPMPPPPPRSTNIQEKIDEIIADLRAAASKVTTVLVATHSIGVLSSLRYLLGLQP